MPTVKRDWPRCVPEEDTMPEVTLRADVDCIPEAMQFLRQHLEGKHEEILTHVELAVEELLVNVARYAYADGEAGNSANVGKLVLGCRWVNMDGQDLFCVWLRDWGRLFDPFRSVDTPDTSLGVDERNIGGLGVHLVKHISSHYVYSGSDGSNTVELFFNAGAPEEGA